MARALKDGGATITIRCDEDLVDRVETFIKANYPGMTKTTFLGICVNIGLQVEEEAAKARAGAIYKAIAEQTYMVAEPEPAGYKRKKPFTRYPAQKKGEEKDC